ncbi:DUF305 domain-containing protein [Nocardia jiangsuensis]|uniref:DUF305 domain-containing protein n=1 Tax=Nocardia jiangsuensis TaxID=1691563 RepID=A0ABV8DLU3_9NOCA
MSSKTVVSALAVALASAAILTGCSSTDDAAGHDGHTGATTTASAGPSTTSAQSQARNDADIAFATEMIPHHRQAVEMAALASSRSTNAAVLNLASRIQAAQDPEIATMTAWLRAWGAPVPTTAGGGMDHGGTPMPEMGSGSMPGMMTDEQMSQMQAASGTEFDRMWLTGMIAHHQGAVEMARTELAQGSNPDAKALAQQIVDAQQAEITEMQGLLQG